MKKFIFLLLTGLFPTLILATEQYDFNMNFGLTGLKFNPTTLQSTTNFMNGDTMFGLYTAMNFKPDSWLIQLEGGINTLNIQSIMSCVSSNQSLNAASSKEHFILDLGANLGYVIKSKTRANLTPFTGLHYRVDTDTHAEASPSTLYDTEVRRALYVPFGINLNLNFSKDVSIIASAQYNWLFVGTYQITKGANTDGTAVQLNSYSPTFSIANGNFKIYTGLTKRFVQGAFGIDYLTVGVFAEQFNLAAGQTSDIPITAISAYTSSVVGLSIIAGF